MASPSVMTSTLSSPPLPFDVPVHDWTPSPVTPDAAAASPFGAQPASASVPPSAAIAPPVMKFLRERFDMVPSLIVLLIDSPKFPLRCPRSYAADPIRTSPQRFEPPRNAPAPPSNLRGDAPDLGG